MYERTYKMAFRKNKGAPAREAHIDDYNLNFLVAIIALILVFATLLSVYFVVALTSRAPQSENGDTTTQPAEDYPFRVDGITVDLPSTDEAKNVISADFISSDKAILVDVTANEIVASRQGAVMIYPASMTKVMTLIVVVENLKSEDALDEVLEIKHEYGDNSGLGYPVGTQLTVKDLLHAALLQSDGIACITLAEYIAGSEAKFVQLMNEKAKEMGIGETTVFQNCTGLHHQYHYSTCRDIAIIMAYAMQNPLCSSILTAQAYKPENEKKFYNALFSPECLYTHQPKKADIIAGKTGWTGNDSGRCIVTYAKGDDGHYYVSVTAKAPSGEYGDRWTYATQDLIAIYNEYVK